ncbi:hypothetical protein SEUCBS139899_004263 [Sporothrix eucalyptigena]|uniref:Uncharacterized protein n=1 Tax=Sporothrix eucalyptigena TaxID=1812306 RepID=A0ABP0BUE3_9PEZI
MAPTVSTSAAQPKKTQADKPSLKRTQRAITRKRAVLGRGQPAQAAIKPLGVLFVATKAPFLSVVNRTVKLLDKGPGGARWSSTKVTPLEERVAAQSVVSPADAKMARSRSVLLLSTGHAITKLVQIAAWFQRQPSYVVTIRTRSSATVDDIFTMAETVGEGDNEDNMEVDTPAATEPQRSTRLRNVNCLEVAVRLK